MKIVDLKRLMSSLTHVHIRPKCESLIIIFFGLLLNKIILHGIVQFIKYNSFLSNQIFMEI